MDSILGGGFPQGSFIVSAGNPGTGKTVFSARFLYSGAVNYHEKGVYVSFCESKEAFTSNMLSFGYDFEKLEKEGKFRFLEMLTVKEEGVSTLLELILGTVREIEAKRLVLDSYTALAQSFVDPYEARIILHTILGKIIKNFECTTLIIEEVPLGKTQIGLGVEEFVADGVIRLNTQELDEYRLREMEIIKLRGAALKDFKLIFTLQGGFRAFTPLKLEHAWESGRFQPLPDSLDRYSTGSESFDNALGGGFPKGSVTLIELDRKVANYIYYMLMGPTCANFWSHGRGAFIVLSSGADPAALHKNLEVYGISEEWLTRNVRIVMPRIICPPKLVEENPNLILLDGEDWKSDLNRLLSALEELKAKTGQPPLILVCVENLLTLYDERNCEVMLNLLATWARIANAALITSVKAGHHSLATKLSPLADVYICLTSRHGSVILSGIKPKLGLYVVEFDASKGAPISKLTPVI